MIDRSEQIELDLPSDAFEVGEDRRSKNRRASACSADID